MIGNREVPASQDENLDIMQGLVEDRSIDNILDETCSTCGGHKSMKRLV